MTVYVIKLVTITTDATWVEEYAPEVTELVESYGGRYLARCPEVQSLEGNTRVPTIAVILEFPDAESARKWHGSAEYDRWLKARQAGSKSDLLLVDGL